MPRFLIKWLLVAFTVLAIPHLVTGIEVQSFGTALALALVLGLLNTVLKPVLIFLTLPFTLVTFGLFLLVVNAVVFWVSALTVTGVSVEGFGPAFFASLIVSVVTSLFSFWGTKDEKKIFWSLQKTTSRTSRDLN